MSNVESADLEHNRHAVAFVQKLSEALREGKIEVPSSPEAALRLQRTLSSVEVDPTIVASVTGAEPALALRVMRMANSAMLNPMGREVRDLRTAISRIGYNMVRTAAVGFVVEQLRAAQALAGIRPKLDQLWEEGMRVAAYSTVITRDHTSLNADVAMLAGLLHGVGKLCILTRMHGVPGLRGHPAIRERILNDWHAGAARAVVQGWSLPEEVADAVELCHDLDREFEGPVGLADVVTVAMLLEAATRDAATTPDFDALVGSQQRFFGRLGLDALSCAQIAEDAAAQVGALQSALAPG